MPRTLTTAERESRDAHFADHPDCWLCTLLRLRQMSKTQLHHIAGKGKRHECRENYSSLCMHCHSSIQSRYDAELLCLYLKKVFDVQHYNPETVCDLRRRSVNCWTHHDVIQCGNVIKLIMEVMR